MKRIKHLSIILVGLFLTGSVSYADFGDAVVGGLVGGAVGSVITNEVYHSNQRTHSTHHSTTHRSNKKHKKHYVAPKMTDEKRIQKALSSLGFYHGKIDGEVNSYETRSAIKEMNRAYEISHSASLKPEVKDMLIYLGTLFGFDRYLIAHGNDSKTKGKKIQTALKIYGYYHGKIDGVVGRGTKTSIAQYKGDNGMSPTGYLDFEEEYQLIDGAKEKNDKNIDESIQSLKTLGSTQEQIHQPHVLKLQAPHQEPASKTTQPSTSETSRGEWE
jgi:peptidoglycan hydrolase-like protein with peptidoglycan-binding domain